MNLLNKIFRRKNQSPSLQQMQEAFDAEWENVVKRFRIVTGLELNSFTLRHPKTQQPMKPHEGLGGTFQDWKQILTAYDRRRMLFDVLYGTLGKSMTVWQVANYLVANRRPDAALALLEESEPPNPIQSDYAQHCASFGKANLNLTRYDEALAWSQKALDSSPNDQHLQTIWADARHISGKHEEAHEVYSRLMATVSNTNDSDAIPEMFKSVFARETGVVSSPVLAITIGEKLSDGAQSEEFWRLAETEFYDSPYFRTQHAYHLANTGAMPESFAKLAALVQEMPWLREASLNLLSYFEHFDPSGKEIMSELQIQLRQTIQQNGWTNEGMRAFEVGKRA